MQIGLCTHPKLNDHTRLVVNRPCCCRFEKLLFVVKIFVLQKNLWIVRKKCLICKRN